MLPHCFTGLCGVAVCFTYSYCIPAKVNDAHNVIFFEIAFNTGDTDR